jgi:hypothetical protein
MSNRIVKGAAGLAALVVIGVGAALIGGATSGDASGNSNASARGGFGPPGAQPGGLQGRPPGAGRGGPGGGFTPATGPDAAKAKAAALKKYPGTVEGVMKLPDGSYVVHVLRPSGEVHVLVDGNFTVKGVDQRPMGPPGFRGRGGQGGPPPGAGGQGGAPPGAPAAPSQPGSGKTT